MTATNISKNKIENWREFLARALIGENLPQITLADHAEEIDEFIRFTQQHGITALLLEQLNNFNQGAGLPHNLVEKLTHLRRNSSVNEIYKLKQLQKTLALLDQAQIKYLLLKGCALAFSIYEKPYLRPRSDCDVLIHESDKQKIQSILSTSGFTKSPGISGDLVSHQASFTRTENNIDFIYDIHWKISNSNAYADRFDFDLLYERKTSVNTISATAFRLSNIDALLHGAVHYFGHFSGERDRLIWLYDLHLLANNLTESDWQNLLALSANQQLDHLLFGALKITRQTFSTPLPAYVTSSLQQSDQTPADIERLRVSGESWSRIEQFKSDWASLNFSKRCQLIKEYLLPPGEFILKQNNSTNKLLLPYFYSKRIIIGTHKILKHPHTD